MPEGGPRKVKTMVVRPDGSMDDAAEPQARLRRGCSCRGPRRDCSRRCATSRRSGAATGRRSAGPAAAGGQAKPAAKPAAQQTAAAAPAAAAPTKYVVQVGSKKNQTDALASFADMQQKYPSLLANYRPMVQKADLGTKGTGIACASDRSSTRRPPASFAGS